MKLSHFATVCTVLLLTITCNARAQEFVQPFIDSGDIIDADAYINTYFGKFEIKYYDEVALASSIFTSQISQTDGIARLLSNDVYLISGCRPHDCSAKAVMVINVDNWSGLLARSSYNRNLGGDDLVVYYTTDDDLREYKKYVIDWYGRTYKSSNVTGNIRYIEITQPRPSPGFECTKAVIGTERSICQSLSLSKHDKYMTKIYQTVKSRLSNNEVTKLISEQNRFLASRNDCGMESDCIRKIIGNRIVKLEKMSQSPGEKANNSYLFDLAPFISPCIIKEMVSWISDSADQLVAVDLPSSQNSNRFFCPENQIKVTQGEGAEKPTVSIVGERESFSYRLIGELNNDVYLLRVSDWGGGSQTFHSIVAFQITYDYGMSKINEYGITGMFRKRTILKTLGELNFDRSLSGDIEVHKDRISDTKGNVIYIYN